MLEPKDKIHVVERRRFEGDLRRHFVGEVRAAKDGVARVGGYAFVFDPDQDKYVRQPDLRARLIAFADAALLIRMLPREADLASVEYRWEDRRLTVTDGATFTLDINEFGARR